MQIRPAKFVSALLVGLVAFSAVAIASDDKAASTVECLARPKGAPPERGHWFYRIDRASSRRCWFVGDEKQKPANEKRAAVAQKPVHSKSKPAMSQPIANARAELQASRVADESVSVPSVLVATAAPPTSDASATADALVAAARGTLARRWSDQAKGDAGDTTGPEPIVAEKAKADPDAPPKPTSEASSDPGLVLATVTPLPAAKISGSANSVGMLMIVLGASLSLAALLAGAVLRFGQR
jgi:hypothetical protein